jgi:hypothetical protein
MSQGLSIILDNFHNNLNKVPACVEICNSLIDILAMPIVYYGQSYCRIIQEFYGK